MKKNKIPYFIEMRGCINCSASKSMKERHGTAYGFDHEIIALCLLIGCKDYGHDLANPFLDAEEIIKLVNEKKGKLTEENLENAKRYLGEIKERFGKDYKKIGVSIDDLIKKIGI